MPRLRDDIARISRAHPDDFKAAPHYLRLFVYAGEQHHAVSITYYSLIRMIDLAGILHLPLISTCQNGKPWN